MENTEKLLTVKDITKVFTRGSLLSRISFTAVNNVSFEIEADKPEIFAIVGESGSGKTTLARIILHLIEPTSGHILYRGKDITKIKSKRDRIEFMSTVQPIFQNPFETFNPLKRVDTYLYETALNYKITNKSNLERFIADILNSVGLSIEEVKGRYLHEFSGGQIQRLSVTRALIVRPSLLVADEPVSMLDVSLRMSIVNLFKELKNDQNVSIIYITHDLATAYYISDRIAIMFRGDVVELGPVEAVLARPLHPYTRVLKEAVPEPTPTQKWGGKINFSAIEIEEFSRVGCKFAGRCQSVMEICKKAEPKYSSVDNRMVKCWLYK